VSAEILSCLMGDKLCGLVACDRTTSSGTSWRFTHWRWRAICVGKSNGENLEDYSHKSGSIQERRRFRILTSTLQGTGEGRWTKEDLGWSDRTPACGTDGGHESTNTATWRGHYHDRSRRGRDSTPATNVGMWDWATSGTSFPLPTRHLLHLQTSRTPQKLGPGTSNTFSTEDIMFQVQGTGAPLKQVSC
jgi:hypothetical protein